jgi:hypothetical protein
VVASSSKLRRRARLDPGANPVSTYLRAIEERGGPVMTAPGDAVVHLCVYSTHPTLGRLLIVDVDLAVDAGAGV